MRWSAQIHACFPVAGVTWDVPKGNRISFFTGLSIFLAGLSRPFDRERFVKSSPVEWQGQTSHDTAHATPIRLTHASV